MKSGSFGIYGILFTAGWLLLVGLIILVSKAVTHKKFSPDQRKGIKNLFTILGLLAIGAVVASLIIFYSIR